MDEPLHDRRPVGRALHASVRLVEDQVEVCLSTVDRVGQDVPERELALVRPALDQAAGLRELLGVEEIDAARLQFRFEKALVDFNQGLGQEQSEASSILLRVWRLGRVVRDPQERRLRVGLGPRSVDRRGAPR